MNQQIKTPLEELAQLRQLLVDHFNEGELHTLCFDLGVDYESLPAEGKANKARELVAHLERRNQIPELLEIGRRLRPEVNWSQTYLDDRMAGYRARRDQADQLRRERRGRQRVVNLRPLDVTHTVMYEHVDLLDAFVSENPDSLLLYQIKEKMTCPANAN